MITFYKYHGAGNDFILIDNREGIFNPNNTQKVQELCHRRFGIGADGIILLENSNEYDFSMVYMNSDGSIGSMCGNGGRCIVSFAHYVLGIVADSSNVVFEACDGLHEARIHDDEVTLKMQDVGEISQRNDHIFLRSGTTPHNVVFVEDLNQYPVFEKGKEFQTIEQDKNGVNVNFVEQRGDVFHVRTYERGVWDETLACGTGATSVAIAVASLGKLDSNICNIKMPGGNLTIQFEKTPEGVYQNIWLTGEAKYVFKGEII